MLCSGRMLACSGLGPGRLRPPRAHAERLRPLPPARRWRVAASAAASGGSPDLPSSSSSPTPPFGGGDDQAALSPGFCIIEGPETVQDFAKLDLQEIQDNIRSRRNKIFLHMEIRRLRIQQRIKNAELGISVEEPDRELPDFPSFIPFLPPLSAANLKVYYATCFTLIAGIMVFGGFLAPILELKLGIGGTSYEDFIRSVHLPMQLSQVDPIVASFSGGAVGVISALMVVEINNVKQQEHKRCKYCLGTGYLACARCSSTGALVLTEPVSTFSDDDQPLSAPRTERCPNCSGAGKVMCPTCLCTGMAMASEHDPRIDPFI
ncbi:protein ORANGE, chloroplastic-like isoform X2 [Panicum virgatum]|uniref:protein ORANGE, chloroplastic-like isoform X2 n=1 Tax=Panicum virgatum TaxID=38727 RepID=UPI0019D5AEC2|nr:protein ORANGE, chloroplastic-like isoform X2 [Panicum virgatum]